MSEPSEDVLATALRVGELQHEVDRLGSFANLGGHHQRKYLHVLHELVQERTVLELLNKRAAIERLRRQAVR